MEINALNLFKESLIQIHKTFVDSAKINRKGISKMLAIIFLFPQFTFILE